MAKRAPSRPSRSDRRAGIAAPAPDGGAVARGTLRLAVFESGAVRESSGPDARRERAAAQEGTGPTVWADYTSPGPDEVAEIAAALDLHPLIVEDIVEGNQRSKIELTDGLIHLVVFALDYRDGVVATEIDLVLGLGFLLTVHDAGWDAHSMARMRGWLAGLMERGPDHLLWAIVDSVVDGYFPFVDRLGDAIDDVQDAVVEKAEAEDLQRLFVLKRELHEVRRAVSPVREILNQLTNRDLALIDAEEVLYFRDVYDHLIRLTDELDNYRELAAGTLDVYLSKVNNNLSEIMKRLTGVTVIVAGVGAVAGIFGMSEAGAAFAGGEAAGFWGVTIGSVVAAAAVAFYLRRIDWI